jgi:hypothetical protein
MEIPTYGFMNESLEFRSSDDLNGILMETLLRHIYDKGGC